MRFCKMTNENNNENTKKNKNSPARLRANRKYFSAHYRRLSISVRNEDFDICMKQIENLGCSINSFFVKSAKYCAENKIDVTKL